MKNGIKQLHAFCLIAILLLCNSSLKAQQSKTVRDDVAHAVGVLKGIYDDYPTRKAFEIITEVAEKDSNAYAMNVLGLLYMQGLGVEKNGKQAVFWLEKAGEKGFCDAYHNLGIIYKQGKCGEKQNFSLAYKYFLKGALNGSNNCSYDVGFMLYKGLGCKQNYAKAIEFFQTASDNGNIYATYMLGLSHRNGYGIEKNEEKGIELLKKAATLGYSAAIEELMREKPENCLTDMNVSEITQTKIPSQMPEIMNDINDTTLIKGYYRGFAVVYDWSGQHVLSEKPVAMTIDREGENLLGSMSFGTDSLVFKADITVDGSLKFINSYVSLGDRYTTDRKVKYKINEAKLDVWEDKIYGSLSLYSLTQLEPERPMYIELYKGKGINANNVKSNCWESVKITPNPFVSQFEAVFELDRNSAVVVRIFDKQGFVVWQQNLGDFVSGEHRVSLCPQIGPGCYLLNISTNNHVLRTIILKNGGK